ncbi:helix-turn-helix domain containing protein [Agreia sp. PsM10]|uniref:TetR/AcrR family transcriptional regulator n=1 Tax=Agreia sp. PsM10 TaxID=3030533 RepID=UPI00263B231C|nr:TetR/AcrR family transcriptional regulator [Agreia sp. PsM10]MDN4640049.1 helix-turn-helix domain containing protein [Agreia sp. PsM10]
MAASSTSRRYDKGESKRREILEQALLLIADRGYTASTLSEIADSVGLTKAGVLHYFESRQSLMAAILQERDAAETATSISSAGDSLDGLAEAMSNNTRTPGLVAMYSRLVVDAAEPHHPAHDYIDDRYRNIVSTLSESILRRQAGGRISSLEDAETLARIAVAVSDGLQLQWSYDSTLDMRAVLDIALSLFDPQHPAPSADN